MIQCYHGMEVSIKPGLIDKWLNVLRTDMTQGSTEGINWAEVLRGYEAGFDSPLGVRLKLYLSSVRLTLKVPSPLLRRTTGLSLVERSRKRRLFIPHVMA